jgi:hypothetical protein
MPVHIRGLGIYEPWCSRGPGTTSP